MSRQKQVIYEIIQDSCEHLSAQEIYEQARKKIPNISVGTVYRNLGQLTDEHKLFRLSSPGGPDRYDKNTCLHGHFICDCCGSLKDLPMPDFTEKISRKYDIDVSSYQLSVYYLCDKCKQSTKKNKDKIIAKAKNI